MVMKLFGLNMKHLPGQYIEGYRIVKKLGEGRFGICYLIADDKDHYIFKQLKKKAYKENPPKVQHEEEILKVLKHKAIPGIISKIENRNITGYILEYKRGLTLEAVIFKQRHVFTRNEIFNIGKQLIDILKYMHGKGIVHRDIRVPNVLLDGSRIYLVDFGAARRIDGKDYKADIDFSYFGDLLLHLYYTSYKDKPKKNRPWYEELVLSDKELVFLKRLMGIEKKYKNFYEVEADFEDIFNHLLS